MPESEAVNKAFKSLSDVLDEEVRVYRVMLDCVRREKDILISAKIDDLEECNKTKEALVLKIRGLERIREKAAREIAQALSLNSESPRLLDIASKLVDPEASRLRSIHSTLDLLIQRIKEFNEGNANLVQSSLKAVNGALGAIRQTLQPKPTYAASGEVKKSEVAGQLVSKEI